MKKLFSAILAAIFTLTLAASFVALPSSAAWDGNSVAVSLSGDGSEANPYKIGTEAELAKVSKDSAGGETFKDKFFVLTASLDLGKKPWTPIGSSTAPFSGTFDGAGFEIAGLFIPDDTTLQASGLFGVTTDATIKNLTIVSPDVSSVKYGGAVIGNMKVTADNQTLSSVFNCSVSGGKISAPSAGAIVGRASTKSAGMQMFISGCSASGTTVTVPDASNTAVTDSNFTNTFIGGIIGVAGQTTVEGCFAEECTVIAGGSRASKYAVAGGIIGCQGADSGGCNVFNCYTVGCTVGVAEGTNVTSNGIGGVLGEAGHIDLVCSVANCFAIGTKFENKPGVEACANLIGTVKGFINFANCWVDAEPSVGADAQFLGYEAEIASAADFAAVDAVEKLSLNSGNSNQVWKDDPASGHPVIDSFALEGNTVTPEYFDPFAEETTAAGTPEDTTAKVEVTTAPPAEETTAAPVEEETTGAPEVIATAPAGEDTTSASEKKGCKSSAGLAALVLVALAAPAVFRKKD